MKRETKVRERTIRVVGSNGIASGRAFIVGIRAGCEDGREVRTRNAPPEDVDAAFLALRSRPIDEKGEALAKGAKPDASTARFTTQNGGPITLPSRFPDEEGELPANKGPFPVQEGRLPTPSGPFSTQPGRLPTQAVRFPEHSEGNQSSVVTFELPKRVPAGHRVRH